MLCCAKAHFVLLCLVTLHHLPDAETARPNMQSVEIDSDGDVGNNSRDCDFDVVTMTELIQMKLEEKGRTTFEEHFIRSNKPVLVLDFLNEQQEWWEKLNDTWGKESWITNIFGREPMVAGIIPYSEHDISAKELKGTSASEARGWWRSYPEKFDNLPPTNRTMQTFLHQIKSYESIRLKAKKFENERKEMSVMDVRILSVPPAYLYHNVNMIKRPNRHYEWSFITTVEEDGRNKIKRYHDKTMGYHLLSNLGNFTPSLLPSYRTQLRTAQFYYGNYGSGTPFHDHGNAINVLLTGKKEWLFIPPSKSTFFRDVHPSLWNSTMEELRQKTDQNGNKKFYMCKQPANSLMYVPKMWSHAVLNTDEKNPTVGVAVEYEIFQKIHGGGLIMASLAGDVEHIRVFLGAEGVEVNQADNNGDTALYIASKMGHVDVVRLLLGAEGINMNQARDDGRTALFIASKIGHVEVVRLLLRAEGVEVNLAKNNGVTALYIASKMGHVDVVRLLLSVEEVLLNQANNDGVTALSMASQKGHVDVVRLFLGAEGVEGVEVNQADNDGYTALYVASGEGHVEVVRLLLGAAGVEVNEANNNGDTALYMASQEGYVDVVRLLLEAEGIEVNQANNNGATALIIASYEGHVDIVRLLLGAEGVEVNQATNDGFTALSIASEMGHVDVVRWINKALRDVGTSAI